MNLKKFVLAVGLLAILVLRLTDAQIAKGAKPNPATQAQLSQTGKELAAQYTETLEALKTLKAEIKKDLPAVEEEKLAALRKARSEVEALQEKANAANKSAGGARGIQAKIDNWKKFRVEGTALQIKKAKAELNAATTDAQREAANKEIAKWEKSKADYEKLIRDAEAELERANADEPALAISGAELPRDVAEDSFNLLPALESKAIEPIRPYLLTRAFGGARTLSIRRGNWKYIDHPGSGGNDYDKGEMAPLALPEAAPDAPGLLYDVTSDPGKRRISTRRSPTS